MRRFSLALAIGASTFALSSCIAPLQNGFAPHVDASPWVPVPMPMAGQMPEAPIRTVSFDTTEGTSMNVDVSPDGDTLIFDLLGDIYLLPVAGGQAVALTSGRAWDQAPRFSPDGRRVYFVSDREGYKNVWRIALYDRSLQQVTRSGSDIMGGLNWSQDGIHLIVGRGDPRTHNTEFILHSVDPITGSMMPIDAPSNPWVNWDTFETLRPSITIYSGVESEDGDVFFSQAQYVAESSRSVARIYNFNRQTQTRTAITRTGASYNEYKPQLSHEGRLLAYYRQYNDRRTEIRILDITSDQDKLLIELTNADDAYYFASEDTTPNYAFTPNDRSVIFWHGGKIRRVNLADGSSDIVPFRVNVVREVWARVESPVRHFSENGEAKIIRWPSVSRDGKAMAFAAIGYIWIIDLTTGEVRRLTDSSDLEYMPVISPDGRSVAYVSFAESENDYGPGRLMIAEVDAGTAREVLAAPNETYLLPKWSRDGQRIALIREVEKESDLEASLGWTPAEGGKFHKIVAAPASNDLVSISIYSRFVGFDETGSELLFSFPQSKAKTILGSADLDGGPLRTLAIGTSEVGGITPAPDLKHLALTRDDGTVWVVPFDGSSIESQVSTTTPDARRISDGSGYYVDWNGRSQLTFGLAQHVYRYQLDDSKFESLHLRVKLPLPKLTAGRPIAFRGARLITLADDNGAGPLIESGTVVVDGARIAMVGPASDVAIPSDAVAIDATGKTIIPGLLDTHYHRIGGSGGIVGVSALKLPNPNYSDRSAIAYGITTAWEPGGAANDGVPATVDLQAAGRIAGPRWSHSGMGAIGYPWELLTSYAAALAAVEQHKNLGVDVLKEYNTPTRQQRQWLSAAARNSGLGIVSHLQSFNGMMTRIVDGYTGGDHTRIPVPFYKDVYELLQQTGYIWTPNIIITPGTVGAGQRKKDYFCHAVLEWRKRSNSRGKDSKLICPADVRHPALPYNIRRFSRVARQVASAAGHGISIGVSAHNMPGSNLHEEMWYLWKGGMPVEDVLRATTIGNAEKLGLHQEIGSLEPGKMADFLVLDANPLDDILNTLSLEYTIQGGVVYDSDMALPVDLNRIQETVVSDLHPGKQK